MAWDLYELIRQLHPIFALSFEKTVVGPVVQNQGSSNSSSRTFVAVKTTLYKYKYIAIGSTSLLLWILSPTLKSLASSYLGINQNEKKMFSKRPDKFATGFINMRNDCFANSSLQAYSSIPSFTEYLNEMLRAYSRTMELINRLDVDLDAVVDLERIQAFSHPKFNAAEASHEAKTARDYFKINLHTAMAKMISKLNNTQKLTRNLSVWTFLREIEKIYNARISKSQHDAHELTQLINETLETENTICIKVLKLITRYLKKAPEMALLVLQLQEFPEFPIGGLVILQMKCLTCAHVSKPGIAPFLMLTLHPPQELSTDINSLLEKDGLETITEYHCLKCRLLNIIRNEDFLLENSHQNPPEEAEYIKILRNFNDDQNLFINEDLPQDIDKYVKTYNKCGLDIQKVTSSVFRETHILKPPKVFGIHLSRSAFNGITLSRNPCKVSFDDKLTLSIDDEYLGDLQKHQLQLSNYAQHFPRKTGVLTTDVNDMEHVLEGSAGDFIQEEVINEREKDLLNTASSENDEVVELELLHSSTLNSDASAALSTDTALGPQKEETLKSAPIAEDQTKNLIEHFGNFKFNDNNVYKYRLRALIRHSGLHIQGHYECFKKKPLFVKDSEGTIFKLAPEIDDSLIEKIESLETANGTEEPTFAATETSTETKQLFRNRISSIIAREQPIVQATPTDSNLQEIIHLGIATPAEVLLDRNDYFQPPTAEEIEKLFDKFSKKDSIELSQSVSSPKVKMKKIPSLIRYPYWRIGDTHVQEVSKSAVLFENASAYMLYYERVDRKQVRR